LPTNVVTYICPVVTEKKFLLMSGNGEDDGSAAVADDGKVTTAAVSSNIISSGDIPNESGYSVADLFPISSGPVLPEYEGDSAAGNSSSMKNGVGKKAKKASSSSSSTSGVGQRVSSRPVRAVRIKPPPGAAKKVKKVDKRTAMRPNHVPWSGLEKQKLLQGIQAHGSKDFAALRGFCPYRTEESIAFFIQKEKVEMTKILRQVPTGPNFSSIVAPGSSTGSGQQQQDEFRKEDRVMDAPIEKWIRLSEARAERSDVGHVLPKVLEWIADHEKHPDIRQSGGVDYRAIYRHLAHLMTGDVPPDTNDATARRIIQLFMTLKEKVKAAKPLLKKEMESLEGYRLQQESSDAQEKLANLKKEALSERYIDKKTHELPGIDPLQLEPEFYDKPVVEK